MLEAGQRSFLGAMILATCPIGVEQIVKIKNKIGRGVTAGKGASESTDKQMSTEFWR